MKTNIKNVPEKRQKNAVKFEKEIKKKDDWEREQMIWNQEGSTKKERTGWKNLAE
jgi:hypothetical protein